MLNVTIAETGARETLSMKFDGIDTRLSLRYLHCIKDFIVNHGGFDGIFIYDEETDSYKCDQYTYDWWAKVINDQEALDERIHDFKDAYGSDAVNDLIELVADVDLEDFAAVVNKALDEWEAARV